LAVSLAESGAARTPRAAIAGRDRWEAGTVGQIGSETLIERLADWDVGTVFGLAVDGINAIMKGLRRHQDRVSPNRSLI
jgi:hypothetical protein